MPCAAPRGDHRPETPTVALGPDPIGKHMEIDHTALKKELELIKKLHQDWKFIQLGNNIAIMCGRFVFATETNKTNAYCDDCGEDAQFQIVEQTGNIWNYCGICNIGG